MIRPLPRIVVERIAAGEVIERPSSVVKELLENALDAGAARIEVDIERGGKDFIRVFDDGTGMDPDDLALAFAPHATSKLTDVEDLLAIASYGFRGEALASIGAVSRARLVSRQEGRDEACAVLCTGGELGSVRPTGAPPGTTVEVRSLFYNIPARQRFLKGDGAESARCLDHVIRLALANPTVAFQLRSHDRTLFQSAANSSCRARFAAAYGPDLASRLITVSRSVDGIHVEALLGPPELGRSSASHQHLYLNGRMIRDNSLRAAVRQAYREFMAPSLQPVYVLQLTMDPQLVDINVHPAKIEVRFRDGGCVFRVLRRVVLDGLRGADLAPRPGAAVAFRSGRSAQGYELPGRIREAPPPLPPEIAAMPASTRTGAGGPSGAPASGPQPLPTGAALPERTGRSLLRLFSTYLLYESRTDLVVVDQHALHERVLFEKLRAELRGGMVARQRLLIPELVEVGRVELLRLEKMSDELARLGLEVTPMGATSLAVHTLPAVLGKVSGSELIQAALHAREPETSANAPPLEERLHSMACHAAVRAGDHLPEGEIVALLDLAAKLPEAQACPHGRPTSIRLSRSDLERWFKRSGF